VRRGRRGNAAVILGAGCGKTREADEYEAWDAGFIRILLILLGLRWVINPTTGFLIPNRAERQYLLDRPGDRWGSLRLPRRQFDSHGENWA
jgi:hypothetical protein